jgi:hypothetical protein
MTLVPPYPGSGWSGAEGPGRKIWGGSGGPGPAPCSGVVSAAVRTADLTPPVSGVGPFSVAIGAPAVAPAANICIFVVSEGTGFLGGTSPSIIGGGWTVIGSQQVGPGGSIHTAISAAYLHQLAIAAPPNLTCSAITGSGGNPMSFGAAAAFGTAGVAPVQSAPVDTTGTSILPGAPSPGNILFMWAVAETNGITADPAWTLIVDSEHFTGGTIGLGGVWLSIGIRCVLETDGTSILSASSASSHWAGVSEWQVP